MAKYNYDIVVIGGGAAGLTASTGAGSLGAKTLLIEKERELGGDCLHYGCVPSKSLIKSAYIYNALKHSEKYGLPRVDVPRVDFRGIRQRLKHIIALIQVHDSPESVKKKYKVETKFGEAKFIDAHTVELNGHKITAKYFIIATGSSPSIPPIEGLSGVPFLTNIEVFFLEKLPTSMVVLGGGSIGLELAQAFIRLGCKITVVEEAAQLLPREDLDIGEFVREKLELEGVDVFVRTKVLKVENDGDHVNVFVDQEGRRETIRAEKLLVATGRKPNAERLGLDNVGIVHNAKGIPVDDRLRTNVKNVFACGDVTGILPFTHVAGYQAGIAMLNAAYPLIQFFRIPVKANYQRVPWCVYLDPEIASVGHNEKSAKEAGIQFTVHKEEIKNNDRAKTESETDGFIKLLIDKKGKPIGVQIISFHAGDLIHEWVAILTGKMSLQTIANTVHAYPTLSEISRMAGLNYFVNAPLRTKLRMIFNV